MYDDYAINENLFQLRQSQKSTKPRIPKGQSYIKHKENEKRYSSFVRESNHDENKNVMNLCLFR